MNKDCMKSAPGMLLYDAFCISCDDIHQQWKFQCDCENGKITINPCGYKICDKCKGNGYK